jgi:Restriction alleviation protein Lar
MNKLKPCPWCDGEATLDEWEQVTSVLRYNVHCDHSKCRVHPCTESSESRDEVVDVWNTRAAPTMKAWEWSEGDGASVVWCCLDFQAFIYSDCGLWRAYVDCRNVGSFATLEVGKAACVAYVEGKLNGWLV